MRKKILFIYIQFFLYIIIDNKINKGKQRRRYKLKQIEMGTFYTLNDISSNVTLVQLMNTFGNVNNSVVIASIWIYYLIYYKETPLVQLSLDIICAFSDDDVMYAVF